MIGLKLSKKENKGIGFRKKIVYLYLFVIILGTLLLLSPFTHNDNQSTNLIDSFFVSASAFSDTGLSPIVTAEVFNVFGQITLLVLIQLGGLGVMSIKVVLLMLIGKKIGTGDRMMVYTEQNLAKSGGMVRLIKDAIKIIFFFQILFTVIIGLHMMINYNYPILKGLWFGFFHATSSINNAGFDLTGNSFIGFSQDYLFQTYIMILIVIGGLGFPVLIDIKNFYLSKRKKREFRFSLFTKVSVITYFCITLIGFLLICLADFKFVFLENSGLKGIFYVLFQVVSARNAGFMSVNLTEFSQVSQLIMALLMVIGAAPASTGGGIRTTTLAVIILFLKSYASNKSDVEVFNRRIPKKTVFNAFITTTLATFLVVTTTLLVVGLNQKEELVKVAFEVASAFGTTGLTLDFTHELDWINKLIIAVVMVIGQMGIANVLIMFTNNRETTDLVRVPEENITIG